LSKFAANCCIPLITQQGSYTVVHVYIMTHVVLSDVISIIDIGCSVKRSVKNNSNNVNHSENLIMME